MKKMKYNTIPKQVKTATSRITPEEWNFIINVLKEQANHNSETLEDVLKKVGYIEDPESFHDEISAIIREKIGTISRNIFFLNKENLEDWFDGEFEREDGIKPNDLIEGQIIMIINPSLISYFVHSVPVSSIEELANQDTSYDKTTISETQPESKFNFWIDTNPDEEVQLDEEPEDIGLPEEPAMFGLGEPDTSGLENPTEPAYTGEEETEDIGPPSEPAINEEDSNNGSIENTDDIGEPSDPASTGDDVQDIGPPSDPA